jgi:hypothetical protein
MDELLTWSPDDVLGDFFKVDSSTKLPQRIATIRTWYNESGILVMGYDMFRTFIHNAKTKTKPPPLDEETHATIRTYLLEGPKIIVADEAHKMKNADAKLTQAAVLFTSKSRIALTGSPLANNVEEYHTMIEWVAPNYLGPASEFRAKYAQPIQQGLYFDSTSSDRRRSLKKLGALKAVLEPKVHRADMSVLRNDLPPKKEFVITVPLTNLQSKAYTIYVRSMIKRGEYATTKSGAATQTTIWHWLAILSLLCNHPDCFNAKLNERKEDAQKKLGGKKPLISSTETTDRDEGADDAVAAELNAPIWKLGVTQKLINEVTQLFQAEADLKSIDHSNKVKVLSQIWTAQNLLATRSLYFPNLCPHWTSFNHFSRYSAESSPDWMGKQR